MDDKQIYRASTTAPVNIAVIKYWGKRSTSLNLPTNSSLSVTLSQRSLRTHTTASCSASYSGSDSLLLNSQPQELTSARPSACLRALRSLRASLEASDPSLPKLSSYPLRIVSSNNFPTAAGLASSAAGFAALVRAIANLYDLPQTPTELSLIARQGSGSACRSLLGGYVAWDMGSKEDGSDSLARVVAPVSHWPNMRALILVVSTEKKGVSSTAGMQATVATSALFKARAEQVVPKVMGEIEEAINEKDFQKFGRITMRDSNSFHACCLDTEPPIFYLNDVSRACIRVVEAVNEKAGKIVAAYTFDAGPNCVVYHEEENEGLVLGAFKALVGNQDGWSGGLSQNIQAIEKVVDERIGAVVREGVSRVILTEVGDGPIKVDNHLVDEKGNAITS
ncbi:diphosphomevalonate decarboxylase [Agyrium rufum]|nr:diphosphomevalonate decarboxylase [Agyrium rufum]